MICQNGNMLVDSWDPELAQHVFRTVDLAGVLCNGIIGGKLARDHKFDYVGFATLAIMSALGGGICRDVMLNQVPIAITDPFYLGIALLGAFIAFLWKMDSRLWRRILILADALVLGCWAATGAAKALGLEFAIVPALLMGVISAVGGGMIRDMASGRIPLVFAGDNLYATPALISAIVMVIMWKSKLPITGMALAIIISTLFVVVSIKKRWVLPQAPEFTITLSVRQLVSLIKIGAGQNRLNRKNPISKASQRVNYETNQEQVKISPYRIFKSPVDIKSENADIEIPEKDQGTSYGNSIDEETVAQKLSLNDSLTNNRQKQILDMAAEQVGDRRQWDNKLETLENVLEQAGLDTEKITIEISDISDRDGD